MSLEKLNLAISAYKSGNKSAAKQILTEIVKDEPSNENAWLWLSGCVSTLDQKKYCINKVLALNPNNQTARQALAQIEAPSPQPSLADISSKPQPLLNEPPLASITKLKCPSCGGELELPNNIGIAHCVFCGTKILLNPTEAARERQNLNRFCELRDVAMKAKNYREAIEYCNRILEIDPKDVDSWIVKATAVCNSSTELNDRYEEGIEYLRKAANIIPNDERIRVAFNELVLQQVKWYLILGAENSVNSADRLRQGLNGTEYTHKSMEYTLKALKCQPDNFQALESVEIVARVGAMLGIRWGNDVQVQLQVLSAMRAKMEADAKLPGLRSELSNLKKSLAKLQTEKGLFVGNKIKSTQTSIKKIESEIRSCEKASSYVVPKASI